MAIESYKLIIEDDKNIIEFNYYGNENIVIYFNKESKDDYRIEIPRHVLENFIKLIEI